MGGKRAAVKQRTLKERLTQRRSANEAQVRLVVKGALPPPGTSADLRGVLKALHKVSGMALPPNIRRKALARLTDELAKVLPETKIAPADLGVKDHAELAERMVKMLERAGYGEYGITELRRKRAGLRHNFAGELFEQLVLHHRELQAIFGDLAATGFDTVLEFLAGDMAMRQTLDAATYAAKTRLLTATGKPAALDLASFVADGRRLVSIERVVDIRTKVGNSWRMFTDSAYVVRFTPVGGGPQRVLILVETEIKLPAAARDFSEQIGDAQFRYGQATEIEMRVLGGKDTPLTFAPDNVIFDVGGMSRNAVTITRRPSMTAAFRYTENSGGHRDFYTRIGLSVQVDDLRRLIGMLFRL